MMSAGSSTRPGGYAHLDNDAALEQFEIEDRRSPAEVVRPSAGPATTRCGRISTGPSWNRANLL